MSKYFNIPLSAFAIAASRFASPPLRRNCLRQGPGEHCGHLRDRGLAASVQLRAHALLSQLKIGYNLPIPPRRDNQFPKNFDVNRFEFSQPGNFSVETFPPSP